MKFSLLAAILLITLSAFTLKAQNAASVTGKVVDANTGESLVGATAILLDNQNNQKYGGMTTKSGVFNLTNVAAGSYKLKVTYVSYQDFEKRITVSGTSPTDAGTIRLKPVEIKTGEVQVTAKAPIAQQNEDTTEYNANAYKTQPNATAEDLIKKVPGVQVDPSGNVKAQGEDVKHVLVDGKPFFGDDPTLALRNLPADVVDKVQVFDKMSDQAEFTGFDDGQTAKALNIITRKDKRKGVFGNVSAGGGADTRETIDGRYSANANVNIFNEGQKISVLGKFNNINEQNFSLQDLLGISGGGGRMQGMAGAGRGFGPGGPGGGANRTGGSGGQQQRNSFAGGNFQGRGASGFNPADFLVSAPNGITTTDAVGTNYTDTWGDKINVSGSYFFNYSNNNNQSTVQQQYFIPNTLQTQYNENTNSESNNYNHRFNMKLDYIMDSSNSITFRPGFSSQQNNKNDNSISQNFIGTNNLLESNSNRTTGTNLTGLNFSGNLLYRHRFDKPGRTFSLNLNGGSNDKTGSGNYLANNEYYDNPTVQTVTRAELINEYTTLPSLGYNLSLNGMYTEPIDSSNLIMLNYTASYQRNTANRSTFDYDSLTSAYDMLNVPLSSKFNNNYYSQSGGLGYRLRGKDYFLTAMVNYQWSKLMNNQDLPFSTVQDYTFNNILPSLMFNYKLSSITNFRLFYRTNTNVPSIDQLQDAIDNTNPYRLTSGNPGLKQEYSHMIVGRYSTLSQDRSNILIGVLAFNYKNNYIANSYFVAQNDTTIGGYPLSKGSQYIRPVNLNGYWSGRSFLTYGLPVRFIGSNVNFNLIGSYTRSPNLVNGVQNVSNVYSVNGGVVVASNISENLDFTLSAQAGWNKTGNTMSTELDNRYNNYTGTANLNWIIWNGIFLEGNLQYNDYENFAPNNSIHYTLLNLGLGKKFLENNRAEIKLYAFDVLNQNKNISTVLSDYYLENDTNLTLRQYLMLKLTYNLR